MTEERKLTAITGVPSMGLDGVASTAYGPEAALTILIPLGAAGVGHVSAIIVVIVALLVILFASYWQTIQAYPSSGGAYVVARENLGNTTGLVAASALMIDYVLNVAVGISAGVGALISIVPGLQPYTLELCLAILVVITLANLRGTIDAGRLFAVPTYLFIAGMMTVLVIGVVQAIAAGGSPSPVVAPPTPPRATEAVTLWILLRAFASGCTAMTGVEAVSNGVSAFKEPTVVHAHRTLTAIVVILGLLLLGVGWLVRAYGIGAMHQEQGGYQSVLSQLTAAITGRGVMYHVVIGSLLCILALSANTSFVDFPRLCRMLAADGYLPRPFASVGRRLVFSVGILYLAVTAALLLIAFRGITEHLIPLFAIGAFLTFTLSQSGMVVHWLREGRRSRRTRWKLHLVINSVGATATGAALVIIIATKFVHGAWITLLVIPVVVLALRRIHRYYDTLEAHMREEHPLRITKREPPVIVVAIESWSRLVDNAISFALQLSPDVYAVHVIAMEGPGSDADVTVRAKWARDVEPPARRAGLTPPHLLVLRAEYRRVDEPLFKLLRELEHDFPARTIAILIPELIKTTWWQYPLHSHRARRLRSRILRYGGSRVVVMDIPWYLEEPNLDEAISQTARE